MIEIAEAGFLANFFATEVPVIGTFRIYPPLDVVELEDSSSLSSAKRKASR